MIDDLIASATTLRNNAQEKRRNARREADPGKRAELFGAATGGFREAINVLERLLRSVRRQQGGHTRDVCAVLEALSQTYGSLGGTLRDAGDREGARDQYDEGNRYEQERREHCGPKAQDSYNMLQRLVVRLLISSDHLLDPAFVSQLAAARAEIDRQVAAGRDDSWVLADQALVRYLTGADANEAVAELERRQANPSFYESAYQAVETLVGEGLGRDGPLGERLQQLMQLLKRKGKLL